MYVGMSAHEWQVGGFGILWCAILPFRGLHDDAALQRPQQVQTLSPLQKAPALLMLKRIVEELCFLFDEDAVGYDGDD